MEKKSFVLNVLLAVILGAGLLVGMVWSAFQPNVVLADLELPAIAALVLIALVIEYLFKGTKRTSKSKPHFFAFQGHSGTILSIVTSIYTIQSLRVFFQSIMNCFI